MEKRFLAYSRLERMPKAKAYVKIDGEALTFYSRLEEVCYIDEYQNISVSTFYGAVTQRHIIAFLLEYAPSVSIEAVKYLAHYGGSMHIPTGHMRRRGRYKENHRLYDAYKWLVETSPETGRPGYVSGLLGTSEQLVYPDGCLTTRDVADYLVENALATPDEILICDE